ncbi:mitochondrial import protein 1, partial [Aspergillus udagawae]
RVKQRQVYPRQSSDFYRLRAPVASIPVNRRSSPRSMADEHSHSRVELYDSGLTVPSDSEIYSANHEVSSPMSTSSSPLILYKPPSIWGILRGAAINLILPFVNGLMLGFGELFAHEAAFRLGWSNTKIFPTYRRSRPMGPGMEIRDIPSRRQPRAGNLQDTTSLE